MGRGALERDGDASIRRTNALHLDPKDHPRVASLDAYPLQVGVARDHEVNEEARIDLGAQRVWDAKVDEQRLQALDPPWVYLLDSVPDGEEVAQADG